MALGSYLVMLLCLVRVCATLRERDVVRLPSFHARVWFGSYELGFERYMLGEHYAIVLEASKVQEET